jgi:hypothetical protein
MGGIIQPDLLMLKGNMYNYYYENIKNKETLLMFLTQEKNKINWKIMGYESTNVDDNLKDLIDKINIASQKKVFLNIPKKGFESFGINNFKDFVKNILK